MKYPDESEGSKINEGNIDSGDDTHREQEQNEELQREEAALQGDGHIDELNNSDTNDIITREQYEVFREELLNTLSQLQDQFGTVKFYSDTTKKMRETFILILKNKTGIPTTEIEDIWIILTNPINATLRKPSKPGNVKFINGNFVEYINKNYSSTDELSEGDVSKLLLQISVTPPSKIFESQTSVDAKYFAEILTKADVYSTILHIPSLTAGNYSKPPEPNNDDIAANNNIFVIDGVQYNYEDIQVAEEIVEQHFNFRNVVAYHSTVITVVILVSTIILGIGLGLGLKESYVDAPSSSSSYTVAQLIHENFQHVVNILDNHYNMKDLRLARADDQNDFYKILLWGKLYLTNVPSKLN
jgi:hypothetical protein